MMTQEENEKDIAWMTEQRDRLKQEVDILNPKLDAATAKLRTQELQIADLERRLAESEKQLAAKAAECDQLGSALTVRTVEANQSREEQAAAKATHEKTLRDHLDAHATVCNARDAAQQLAERRRLALADLLKQHSDGIARLMPLVTE